MPQLQQPIMPQIANANNSLQYVTQGLASLIQQRQRNQQLELANQKMIQDAANQQQHFELTRQQLAQSYELQQHNMANIDAETRLHNAAADASIANAKNDTTSKAASLNSLNEYVSGFGTAVPNNIIGTDAGQAAINDWQSKHGAASLIPEGVQLFTQHQYQQKFREKQLASQFTQNTKNYNNMLTKKGIADPTVMNSLDIDPETGTFTPNNVWGSDATGKNPYITLDAGHNVIPPQTTVKMTAAQQKAAGYYSVGFTLPEAQAALSVKNRLQKQATTFEGPPLPALKNAAMQDQIDTNAQSIPQLTDPAQVAGLPSGTKFLDPNGILSVAP